LFIQIIFKFIIIKYIKLHDYMKDVSIFWGLLFLVLILFLNTFC